jgi:cell division protein FtsB
MFDFYEKRKIRSVVYSKLSIALLLILSVWLSVSVYERFSVEREMAHKREAQEKELEILKARAAVLESQVEHLEDDRGIEEELRTRFDVVKEGEQVVVILDGEDGSTDLEELSQPPGGESEDIKEVSFWASLKFW